MIRPAEPVSVTPQRMSRLSYGLALVDVVKLRAACTRRQVGVVILDDAGRVVATGYNGTAAGDTHCIDGGCPRGAYTYDQIPGLLGNDGHEVPCVADHAEDNATAWALAHGVDPTTSLVVISCPPCPPCKALLHVQAWGTVVYRDPDHIVAGWGDWTRWAGPDAVSSPPPGFGSV